jgi:hypothetical protein
MPFWEYACLWYWKTCAVLCHCSQWKCVEKPNIIYKNIVTVYGPNINLFAITLTENPKWHGHIGILCKGLKKAQFVVECLKEVMSQQTVTVFYLAYFQSPMKYSIIFWLTDCYSKMLSSEKVDLSILSVENFCVAVLPVPVSTWKLVKCRQ